MRLAQEYVERDARGERLQTNPWFLNAVVWPDESAYDSYTVITGYDLIPIHADSSTGRVRVVYRRSGFIERAGPRTVRFVLDTATETRVFTAALTDNGWRIVAPQMEQHVLAGAVPAWTPLDEASWQRVKALAGRGMP